MFDRARIVDVVSGRSPLVGARLNRDLPRGYISPVEARVHLGLEYGDLASAERELLAERTFASDLGIVVRSMLSSILASRGDDENPARTWVVSTFVDNLSIAAAIDAMVAPIRRRARMIHFVHPHAINLATTNRELKTMLRDADVVLPDGVGLRLAARILGVALKHNVNGTDLLPQLCERAAKEGIPLVLIGGAKGVAEDCAAKLCAVHPGLHIPIVSDGFLDDSASRELIAQVQLLKRAIVLVGMGTPIQERWAWTYARGLDNATVLTVGGLFDFYSERVARAPIAWRELGLEWLFRLTQEPKRLFVRYVVGNPVFVLRTCIQRLSGGRNF